MYRQPPTSTTYLMNGLESQLLNQAQAVVAVPISEPFPLRPNVPSSRVRARLLNHNPTLLRSESLMTSKYPYYVNGQLVGYSSVKDQLGAVPGTPTPVTYLEATDDPDFVETDGPISYHPLRQGFFSTYSHSLFCQTIFLLHTC